MTPVWDIAWFRKRVLHYEHLSAPQNSHPALTTAQREKKKKLRLLTYLKILFWFAFLLFQRQLTHSGAGEEAVAI